jgi:hypothetical protein
MILKYNTIHSEIQIKKYNTICLMYIKNHLKVVAKSTILANLCLVHGEFLYQNL